MTPMAQYQCFVGRESEAGEGSRHFSPLLFREAGLPYVLQITNRSSQPRINNCSDMEDTMKFPTTLLSLVLAGAVFVGLPAQAFQAPADQKAAPAAAKETKWQGHVTRIDAEHSMI